MEELEIIGKTEKCFKDAMSLIGKYGQFTKVEGYKVQDNHLLFYWYRDCKECECPFPYDMTLEQAADFAWGWLQNTKPDCDRPDTDGSTAKGWYLKSSDMCYQPKDKYCHESYCFVVITPTWLVYGK